MSVFEIVKFHLTPTAASNLSSTSYYSDIQVAAANSELINGWEGQMVEDPTKAFWVFEWESMEVHQKWIDNKTIYDPFVARLQSICDPTFTPSIEVWHFPFPTSPLRSLLSSPSHPFIELFQCTLNPSTDASSYSSAADGFLAKIATVGTNGVSAIAKEDGKTVTMLIGWKSLEEHAGKKRDKFFGGAVKPLLGAWGKPRMGHVRFNQVVGGGKARL